MCVWKRETLKRHKLKGSEGNACRQTKHHGFEKHPLYNCQKFVQLDAISLIQRKKILLTSTRSKQTLCPIQNQDVKICFNRRHEKKIRIPYNSRLWRCIPRSNSVTQNKQATRLAKSVRDLFLLYFTKRAKGNLRILF